MKKKVIQTSIVHFGDNKFSSELKSNLLSQLEHENPDYNICRRSYCTGLHRRI